MYIFIYLLLPVDNLYLHSKAYPSANLYYHIQKLPHRGQGRAVRNRAGTGAVFCICPQDRSPVRPAPGHRHHSPGRDANNVWPPYPLCGGCSRVCQAHLRRRNVPVSALPVMQRWWRRRAVKTTPFPIQRLRINGVGRQISAVSVGRVPALPDAPEPVYGDGHRMILALVIQKLSVRSCSTGTWTRGEHNRDLYEKTRPASVPLPDPRVRHPFVVK